MIWSQMIWSQMIWSQMIWIQMIWSQMSWSQMICSEMIWSQMSWSQMIWSQMIWSQMSWSQMIWSQMSRSQMIWSQMSNCHMRVTATHTQDWSLSVSLSDSDTMVVEATDWLVAVSLCCRFRHPRRILVTAAEVADAGGWPWCSPWSRVRSGAKVIKKNTKLDSKQTSNVPC